MEKILRFLFRDGFKRGFRGEHSLWFVIGAAAWLALRATRQESGVVYRTVLKPGEQIEVVTRRPTDATGDDA